ncbi:MAG: hypothetical protein K0R27_5221 [Xanthobacteraceae bacterium]|nr:hypothetical protein [Xanthobacteraceae bacterium]
MFSLLRAALVIGAIFYFSPVRHGSEGSLSLDGLINAVSHPANKLQQSASGSPERLEAVWNALPESAKQAVLDRIKAGPAARTMEARQLPQTDTLQPEDHRPAWVGTGKKPGA